VNDTHQVDPEAVAANAAFLKEFSRLQSEVNVKKGRRASGGARFAYRGTDDIYEEILPRMKELGWFLTYNDTVIECGGRVFISSTVFIGDVAGHAVSGTGLAQMPSVVVVDTVKDGQEKTTTGEFAGMNSAQTSGAVLTYARKYALDAVFALADKDADDFTPDSINTGQIKEINQWIENIKEKGGFDHEAFLKYMGVEMVEEIGASDFDRAIASLKAKMKQVHGDDDAR